MKHRASRPRPRLLLGVVAASTLAVGLLGAPGAALAADGSGAPAAADASSTDPGATTTTAAAPTTTTTAAAPTTTTTAAAPTTTTTTAAATTTTTAPTTSTGVPAPVAAADPACLPLTDGRFVHTFDPRTLTLTVAFDPSTAAGQGAPLCGGGQAFTVATWATQATGYALPQRLLGTTERTVTTAGAAGTVVVTAPAAAGCAAQVDAYMAPASAVPAVLTGFNTGEPRPGGADAGAVNEPPLVGTPQAPYPSDGTVAGQQPYTLVAGRVCTLPATLDTSTSCTDGTMTGTLLVTNPNPWTVRYEVLLDGTPVDAPELSDRGIEGGRTEALSATLQPGTYTVRVVDENDVDASTTVTVAPCDTTTATPPATTPADPTVSSTSTQRTLPTDPATTGPEVAGVAVTRTTDASSGGSGVLASTGASVGLPLGLGAGALVLGTGFLLLGRAARGRHAR